MKNMKILPTLLAAALLIGCAAKPDSPIAIETYAATAETVSAETAPAVLFHAEDLFSNRDLEGAVDLDKAVSIALTGNSAQTDAPGVGVEGSTVTITQEGVYLLSGSLNGQIIVDADKADKVQLVLNGAQIICPSSAAIYAKKADKVFITLADNAENSLSNSGSFTAIDDTDIDGVVYSKTDLTLNGTGSLMVDSPAGHGIVSKDELVITGGSYEVNAAQHGFTGKDCISIAGGSFNITAGEDGFHAKHSDDDTAGFLFISGGSFQITAQQDGLSATGPIQMEDGSFTITTGGGSEAVTMRPSDGMARSQSASGTYGKSGSFKGIKSDSSITISGGSYQLDCADDGIHAGGSLNIQSGDFQIRTADDGIHSDTAATIDGGTISIPYCYEGIEGQTVTVNGGTIDIISQDDGINAAGGMDNSGMDFRQGRPSDSSQTQPDGTSEATERADRPQRGNGSRPEDGSRSEASSRPEGGRGHGIFGGGRGGKSGGDSSAAITINGGTITVKSQGDSLDSNGSIILTGGTLNLTCGGNGNTAIDCDGNFTNTGAKVTTNDGSENGGMFTPRKSR